MNRAVIVLALGTLVTGCSPSRWACYKPADQSAGWKTVDIPVGAPALAAPEGIEQFRDGEPAIVWETTRVNDFAETTEQTSGATTYRFELNAPAARAAEVHFTQDLEGAKVDVVAYTLSGATVSLQSGERAKGNVARVQWSRPDVTLLDITVHEHFRPKPVVRDWRAGRLKLIEPNRGTARLHYLSPGGRSIELCNREGARLEIADAPRGTESSTHATPNLLARLNEKLSSR